MTEAEWLLETDPHRLLREVPVPASRRKLRLFALACCQPLHPHLTLPSAWQTLETAFAHAEGLVSSDELGEALRTSLRERPLFPDAHWAALLTALPSAAHAATDTAVQAARILSQLAAEPTRATAMAAVRTGAPTEARDQAWHEYDAVRRQAELDIRGQQAELVRDLFGNPFRITPLHPSWLHWREGAVQHLAQAIYDEGRFEDLPILADALEEAGCEAREWLAHCRAPSHHTQGCWLVDRVLGLE